MRRRLMRSGTLTSIAGALPGIRSVVVLSVTVISLLGTRLQAQSPGLPPRIAPGPGRGLFLDLPTVPLVLRVPASANALAMGNVGVTLRDAEAVFYNVGMLTQARGVGTSLQRFGADATAGSIASVQTLGAFSYGVGARFLSARAPVRVPAGGGPDATVFVFDSSSVPSTGLAVTAAVGRAVGPLRIGLGATYVQESNGPVADDATLFDIGVVYPIGPINLSLNVQHLGSAIKSAPVVGFSVSPEIEGVPWRAVLGFGGANAPIGTFLDLSLYSQVAIDASSRVMPALGTELAYVPVEGVALAGRLGVRRAEFRAQSAMTAGLGFSIDRFSLDYAIEPFIGAPDAHRVGVRIR